MFKWQGIVLGMCMLASQAGVTYSDPTMPAGAIETKGYSVLSEELSNMEQDLQLSSVLVAQDRKHVVINGKTLHEGDTIQGYTIKQITRYQVTLTSKEDVKKLKVGKYPVKIPLNRKRVYEQ